MPWLIGEAVPAKHPYAVVAAAIGHGFDVEPQRGGCGDAGGRRRLSLARQDGQDVLAGGDAGLQGFGSGRLDRVEALVALHAQHCEELTVADDMALQLDPKPSQPQLQGPVLECAGCMASWPVPAVCAKGRVRSGTAGSSGGGPRSLRC